MNEEKDDFVTNVLKYLGNEVESGSGQKQPTSANDMSRAITDYCIYTYERKRKADDSSGKETRYDPEAHATSIETTTQQAAVEINTSHLTTERKHRSVRQVYTDYVNEIVSTRPFVL